MVIHLPDFLGIGHVFGGHVKRARTIMHGKTSLIYHKRSDVFKNISNPFVATRYHSLIVEKQSIRTPLRIIAWTKDQEVMGLRHVHHPTFGVQFHPESILTTSGKKILLNFLRISGVKAKARCDVA